jgi:hypothetical protein
MSVADKGSYFSRFTTKLFEIVAAGIATAVSGYLVAHLSGYWSSPVPPPAAVQVAPMSGALSKGPSGGPGAPPAGPVSADGNGQYLAPAQDAGRSAAPPLPAALTTGSAGPAVPARKRAEPGAAESKPHDAAENKRGTAESKARDTESVEAQVRAALAKVDASQPAPAVTPPHAVELPPAPPAVAAPLKPAEAAVPAAGVETRAADPPPVPQAPLAPAPLGTVEIKSQPVATVDAAQPPASAAPADTQANDRGLLSAIAHLPDMLRPASRATAPEPPRPPLPVGSDQ